MPGHKRLFRNQINPGVLSRNSNFRFRLQLQASKVFGSGCNIYKFLAPAPERFGPLKTKKPFYIGPSHLPNKLCLWNRNPNFRLRLHHQNFLTPAPVPAIPNQFDSDSELRLHNPGWIPFIARKHWKWITQISRRNTGNNDKKEGIKRNQLGEHGLIMCTRTLASGARFRWRRYNYSCVRKA